jgi:flagellar hook-associated protein 2
MLHVRIENNYFKKGYIMAGTINSLGIGSGVLTSDIIEKLKANDEKLIVKPIETKIGLEEQKGQALDLLGSLLSTYQTSVKALDDDSLYQQREVSGNNSDVSVEADAGVSVQSFSISDTHLALANVIESGKFTSKTANISTGDGTMTLGIDSKTFDIAYTSSTTLEELKDSINEIAGDKLTASILQIGEDDYRLVLTSDETGDAQNITISDSAIGSLDAGLYRQNDSIMGGAFSADTDLVASGAGNMTVTVDSQDYIINYDATTKLSDLVTAINSAVGSDVASIKQTDTNAFNLVLDSTLTGSDPSLAIIDNSAALDAKITTYTENNFSENIQTAQDSSFKYNGISISRSSNTIDDLMVGVTINLLQESGSANIDIKQDVTKISDEVSAMVGSYNELMAQLDKLTLTDLDAGKVGIFNGDNTINSIGREIRRELTSINDDGYSLPQFGIDIAQDGTMSFNSSTFSAKFNEDTTKAERFFSGASDIDSNGNITVVDGLFTSLKDKMNQYIGTNGLISTLTTASENEAKSLLQEHTKAKDLLTSRYDTLTARFIQYDAIISRLNNQFSSLQQQIEMTINGN